MAAPPAHLNQDNSAPIELQHPLVPPQADQADRPSASNSPGLGGTPAGPEQVPPLPVSPRKLSRTRNHPSRHVLVASPGIGGQDTGGLVLGEPVTMEELRWERAKFIKRRTRRWRAIKECLGLAVLSWTIYQTVRYFVAYQVYNEDITRIRFAFALGLLSGLGASLLIIYKVFDYLPRDHILIKGIIVYLSSLCIFATALVNAILVPKWRYGTPSDPFSMAHSLQGRCKWDVDIIWTGMGNQCRQRPVPYGAFVAAAVTRIVLTTGFLVAFHLAERQYAIVARLRRSYSATRLMGGKADSALHPSTSRLSSAPTVDATSPTASTQRGKGSPSGTTAMPSPILSPASITTPLSPYFSIPNTKSPLPAVPEMIEVETIQGPSPLEFGKRAILGGTRWPDDPDGIESPDPTPLSELPPPTARGSSPHIDRGGYFGNQGRETPSDASGSVDDDATWQADFRGLMQSLAADRPSSSDSSDVQQRVIAQLRAMGAPMSPGGIWDREVPIVGGVVRRMSTIESIGSREREHAPDGASDYGVVRTSNSPSPVELRSVNRGSRPPSRSGTAATASPAASGSSGSRQNTRAGTDDSREPRSES